MGTNTTWEKIAEGAKTVLPDIRKALDTFDPLLPVGPLKVADEALSAILRIVEAGLDLPTEKQAALERLRTALADGLVLLDADIALIGASDEAAKKRMEDANPADLPPVAGPPAPTE